jgi:hypothetical protein
MISQDRLRTLARELGVRQGYAEKNYVNSWLRAEHVRTYPWPPLPDSLTAEESRSRVGPPAFTTDVVRRARATIAAGRGWPIPASIAAQPPLVVRYRYAALGETVGPKPTRRTAVSRLLMAY